MGFWKKATKYYKDELRAIFVAIVSIGILQDYFGTRLQYLLFPPFVYLLVSSLFLIVGIHNKFLRAFERKEEEIETEIQTLNKNENPANINIDKIADRLVNLYPYL